MNTDIYRARQKDRIKQFIKHTGLCVRAFEQKCGMSNGLINNAKRGLGDRSIEKVVENFPELNIEWLITGEGSMLVGGEVETEPQETAKVEEARIVDFSSTAIITSLINEMAEQRKIYERIINTKDTQIDKLLTIIKNR